MATAVVVGSGPNGLAAAVTLAQRGIRVQVLEAAGTPGGGARSTEALLPGLLHDECSAVHPTAIASPFFASLGLERYGLRWAWPEVDVAHPLDDGSTGALWRDLDRTVEAMGSDGPTWRHVVGKIAQSFDRLAEEVFQPVTHVPHHPMVLARYGALAALPATWLTRLWRTPQTKALFAGLAAHSCAPLTGPFSSAVGLFLAAAAHTGGWPVAIGGSQSIITALTTYLTTLGGTVETGVAVDNLAALDRPDVVLLDVSPGAAVRIIGDRLPIRIRRALTRFPSGPAVFKVDIAVRGSVPWTHPWCAQAGTVHLGGSLDEVVRGEDTVASGRMPQRPFVLVGQQYLADPSRSAGDVHPVWAYAHVPRAYRGDVTQMVLRQIERFAPGLCDRIVSLRSRSVADLVRYNANYVDGDIGGGSNRTHHLLLRPRVALDPYAVGVPGVFLCSAATPPGAGVHGMCGANAARSALRYLGLT
jgi:phytoene dehydrogenase-like protein